MRNVRTLNLQNDTKESKEKVLKSFSHGILNLQKLEYLLRPYRTIVIVYVRVHSFIHAYTVLVELFLSGYVYKEVQIAHMYILPFMHVLYG